LRDSVVITELPYPLISCVISSAARNLRSLAFARDDNGAVCDITTQSLTGEDRGEGESLSRKGRGKDKNDSLTKLAFIGNLLFASILFPACQSEILQRQAEQIKQQEEEIARQRKEINDLLAGQKLEEQKRGDCNRAFREFFEKAATTADREKAIALYRDGLVLCPDDDVAHYELGKVLLERGRLQEAEKEFEAALKINPAFVEAKKQLDSIRKSR